MAKRRRVTIAIDVDIRDRLPHEDFAPGTLVAESPSLGVAWVGSNERDVIYNFFQFFMNSRTFDGAESDERIRQLVETTLKRTASA